MGTGTVAIVDYGLGNLRSVAGAVKRAGFALRITCRTEELEKADKLILPGVGAFGDGMKNLRERGLVETLTELVIRRKKPILGICLGCQLLARESEEFGRHAGLGWLAGAVVRLRPADPALRVPHVGWDDLVQKRESILFRGIAPDALFYYVHSYYVQPDDPSLVYGECDYGMKFPAVLQRDNIYATQFHPEKSQRQGLDLLKNFLDNA
ncbi:MAG TPA: imidazole glycerol phosphate synthase subunit HisH [Elusimicrobiota bacterium]|nr:imidazole glycerol phosphate synthase subunit HisH [Elusimicrobiota bacterium]